MPQANVAAQPPASASKPLATGTATVTVACKYPTGHRARLHAKRSISITTPSGNVQQFESFQPTGEEFEFKGPQHAQNEGPRVLTASGFALTRGVPADFWDRWLAQHKDFDLVKKGLIFAFSRENDVRDAARERKGIATGLERLDPTKPMQFGSVKVLADPDSPYKLGKLDSDTESDKE